MAFLKKEERAKDGSDRFFNTHSSAGSDNFYPCQKSSDNYLSHYYPPLISEYNAIS
jgi:hypothetical protein